MSQTLIADHPAAITLVPAPPARPACAQSRPRAHGLPSHTTPFVGREAELAELADLLADPACRLITIVGPGGIGKTRLAIQLAGRVGAAFEDGVAFVDLQPVSGADGLVMAVAAALSLPLTGAGDPRDCVLQSLAGAQVLLVLDNFEHLAECADLLVELLRAGPGVKLLVTSRRVLSVQEEWLYPLDGLDLPAPGAAQEAAHAGAVRLFVEHARRIRRDFSLEAEREAVVQICRLTSGVPLAIELAAAWTRTLPCSVIAEQIAGGAALLETRARNAPARHRSIRAVCDQSWAYLSDDERRSLAQLSVFPGGFTREAAGAVASASLGLLAALVDQSLVRVAADGRYSLHELLRQYAAERLEESGAADATRRAFAAYYAQLLAGGWALMTTGQQREAVAEIDAELDNIRAAWPSIVQSAPPDVLHRALLALAAYYRVRGPLHDGQAALSVAEQRLRAAGDDAGSRAALASLLVVSAQILIRLGKGRQAEGMLQESVRLLETYDLAPPPGADPLIWLAASALVRGEYAQTARLAEAARARSERHGLPGNASGAWLALSEAALNQGRYRAAQRYAALSHAAAEQAGDRWLISDSLNQLGKVACALGAYDEAQRHFQRSYELRAEFDDRAGMACALSYLGLLADHRAAYDEARAHYERSLTLYCHTSDPGATAQALGGLGRAAAALGDQEAAAQHFRRALELASSIGYIAIVPALLVDAAELLSRAGRLPLAVEVLVSVLRHPATNHQAGVGAQELLLQAAAALGPAELAAAGARGQARDLTATCDRVLEELEAPLPPISAAVPAVRAAPAAREPLLEPLTEREREVLELIAEGLSNQAIADRLILSVGTVKWYTGQIYSKLGVQTRTQAIARAREAGVLA